MNNIISKVDRTILFSFIGLVFIGLFLIADISTYSPSLNKFIKQIIWIVISIPITYFFIEKVDFLKIRKISFFLVVIVCLMLLYVLIFGSVIKGAKRYINLGFMSFQPSLLARIVLILYFAHIMDKKREIINRMDSIGVFVNLLPLFIFCTLIFSLIFAGRHLSILVIISLTLFIMIFAARIPLKIMFTILIIIFFTSTIAIIFGPKYRVSRIEVYKKYNLFTMKDVKVSKDEERQVRQSLIALASGKYFGGKGRAKDRNMPEPDTDYIFSIIGEQWGFFGSAGVFLLYILLYIKGLVISVRQKSFYLKLLGIGITHNIFYNVLVHIGVCMSLLPATGVTLPFISYGGSSMLINSISIGFLLNISKNSQ